MSTHSGEGQFLYLSREDVASAGLGVNLRVGDMIYQNILAHRKVPSDVFTGSDAARAALWAAIQNPQLR